MILKVIKSKIVIISLLLLNTLCVMAQGGKSNNTVAIFNQYNKPVIHEKVFMHTDKNFYLAGELLWFKLYSVEGMNNQPLSISRFAYVEVIDKSQRPILQTKVLLNNSSGAGSLFLPAYTQTGTYTIRAYTNWMKNFDPGFYFEKQVSIINTLQTTLQSDKVATAVYDIQFFPEGGHLVAGIESKVAFRAINEQGKSVNIKGAIINQNNDTLVRFTPLKFGIGSFKFMPLDGNAYKAIINLPSGQKVNVSLPAIAQKGYVMQVTGLDGDKLSVTVKSNLPDSVMHLFVHTRNRVKVDENAKLVNGSYTFIVNRASLGEGISHFTLLNAGNKPLCERLYFKQPEHQLTVDVLAAKQYGQRQEVLVDVLAKDEQGKSKMADLSMSVYSTDLNDIPSANIYSYLWLNSDLKGTIESPEYYFKDKTAETAEATDNLMLTHGWRKFKWAEVMSGQPATLTYLPEYKNMIVSAKINQIGNNEPVIQMLTFLSVTGIKPQVYAGYTNKAGLADFFINDVYDLNEIIVQPGTRANYKIDVLSPYSDQYSNNPVANIDINKNLINPLLSQSVYMQVQNIYNADKLNRNSTPQIDSSLTYSSSFYGHPKAMQINENIIDADLPDFIKYKSMEYKLSDYTRFPTIKDIIHEYVHEVIMTRQNGKPRLKILGASTSKYLGYQPLAIIDGTPIIDSLNRFLNYNAKQVERLGLIREEFFVGPVKFGGVVYINTYKPDQNDNPVNANYKFTFEGLQTQREFYSPVYDSETAKRSRVPDFREVLYWSPELKTNGQGKVQAKFYTSDKPGKYTIIVQGITADGFTGSKAFNFEVKTPKGE